MPLEFKDIEDCIQLNILNDIALDGDEHIRTVPFLPDHVDSNGTVWCPIQAVSIAGQDRAVYLAIPKACIKRIIVLSQDEAYDSPQTRGIIHSDRTIDS